ncbi:MAG: CHAP domain-containing protein, partial [Candidatus Micrarchaeaceae archaeon]
MLLDTFISECNGQVVTYDNVAANAGQASQLIARWCSFVGLPFQWANPADWWDDSDDTFLQYWDKVVNDRKNAKQLPRPGDIIIFDSSLPGSGSYGHASIFIETIGPN